MKTYTTRQIAEILGVTPGRVRHLMQDLRYADVGRRPGRDWIFTESDLKKIREIRES